MVGAGPSSVRTKSERARRLLVSGLGTLVAACSPPDAGTRAETTWQAPEPPAQAEPALSERIAQFERAVDESPSDALAVGRLGLVYEANQIWPQARTCFERARRLDPGEPAWFEREAYLLRLEGQLPRALEVAREGLALHPSDAALLDDLGSAALDAGRFDEALAAFERMTAEHPGRARGPLGSGEVWLARGEPAKALDLLERALALDRRDPRAHYVLGCALRDVGRTAEAEVELRLGAGATRRRMADRWSDELVELSLSRTLRNERAIQWMQQGKLAEARRLLEETLTLDPSDARTLSNLGLLYRQIGEAPLALAALERAAQLAPDSYQARTNFGQALVENGYFEEALLEARAAVAAGPRVPQTHMLLSDVLFAHGQSTEGRRELETALDCAPNDVGMRLHAAQRMQDEGAPEAALAVLAEAARIAPQDPRPEQALAALLDRIGRSDEAREHGRRAEALAVPSREPADGRAR